MTNWSRRLLRCCAATGLFLTCSVPADAQVAVPPDTVGDAAVREWVRTRMPDLMRRFEIPGAVVSAIHGDRLIINEGFGVSDLALNTPVDAATTVFRIASVSKVFTAAAALQLVQARRIGLTQDLRTLIPYPRGQRGPDTPITLHELLTHTAGFDEQLIGYLNPPGATAAPLAEYLGQSLPPRTRVDDAVPGYSNHGYGLIGLAVERVSGQSFDLYARDSVFRPLGMLRTSFILQPGASDSIRLAREYRSDGTVRVPRSSRAYPAGNVGTTGTDMIAFMRWLVAGIGADSSRSGSPIVRQLIGPMLTYDSLLPPMGYGLAGVPIAGRTVWMKGGASPSHSAVLAVLPELGVSLFVAVNRQEAQLWDRLIRDLVTEFWAQPAEANTESATRLAPAADVVGDYRWTRAPLGSPEKVIGLAAQVRVASIPSGVSVRGPEFDGNWTRIAPRAYHSADGRVLAFRIDSGGTATHLFSVVQGQPVSFERIPYRETARFQLATLGLASVLSIAAAGATIRRGADPQPNWARVAVAALPVMELATAATGVMLTGQADLLMQGPTGTYHAARMLACATGLVGVSQAVGSASLAAHANTSTLRRSIFSLGAIGGAGIAWFLGTNRLACLPF